MLRLTPLILENYNKQCWAKLLSKAIKTAKKRLDKIFKKDTLKSTNIMKLFVVYKKWTI